MQPTPQHLAAIHAAAFDAPWDEQAFDELLNQPGVAVMAEKHGFILVRIVADEAEILTLAVAPEARRRGLGRRLVDRMVMHSRNAGASRLFLEVAEDNMAARAMYGLLGFEPIGRRCGYYARAGGAAADALVLTLKMTQRLP